MLIEILVIGSIFVLTLLFLLNQYHKNETIVFVVTFVLLVIGIIIYGHGFYLQSNNYTDIITSIFKTIRATLRMFTGADQYSDIKNVDGYNHPIFLLLFWFIHVLALSLAVHIIILNFGKRFVVEIRNLFAILSHKNNIYIFYKYKDKNSDNSLTAETINRLIKSNKNIKKFHKNNLLIVLDKDRDSLINNNFKELIIKNKCLLYNENFEKNSFLLKILFNNKKYKSANIKLFALNRDFDANYEFAKIIYDKLIEKSHNNVSLTILIDEQYDISKWQNANGFDYIRSLNEKDLIARELVKEYPPCNYVNFENLEAKCNEEFNCLIIGFGELGNKILKRLFVYSQFSNCKIKFIIIDENYDDVCAQFDLDFDFALDNKLLKDYEYITKNVEFKRDNNYNARSKKFYDYIIENANKLDYVVCTTSSAKTNNEIVRFMLNLRKKYNASFDIFDCLDDRIFAYIHDTQTLRKRIDIYDYLADDKIDISGKLINYAYTLENVNDISSINLNDKKIMEQIDIEWKSPECSAFDKASSISSAEFYKTILKIIKSDNKNLNDDNIIEFVERLSKDQLNKLGNLEHNRWSSFLLTEGYRLMTRDEWNERVKMYESDKSIKIQNDTENYKHACLIPYNDLDKFSEMQKKITNEDPKYCESDIKNIKMSVKIYELIKGFNENQYYFSWKN